MEQLLQERTGCVTSIGELINEKLPSIKEALAGSTVDRRPSTDELKMENGKLKIDTRPRPTATPSNLEGELDKNSPPKLGGVPEGGGSVSNPSNNQPKKQLTPELLDLKKAINRGAYKTLQGEVSATKLVETAKPTMDTLVAPLLPRVGIVSLVGSSDSGKSSLLRGLALAVASGAEEWLSLPLRTHHQSALYISTEDDEDAIATLLHKQNQELGLSKGDLAGLKFLFDVENLTLRLELMLSERPVDLIVVDAFSDLYRGSMNENNQVRTWLQRWHEIAQKYECLVIFLHHTGKRTEALLPSKHNSIGSQGFEAKMRLMMELRTDRTDTSLRHLCVVKGNYLGPEWKGRSMVLRFSPGLNFSNTGERVAFEELCQWEQSSEYYGSRRGSVGREQEKEERYGQIMDLIAEGLTYEQIAQRLGYGNRSSVANFLNRYRKE